MLNNAMDDEVPLTEIKQNVAVATRDNFDELLQTVLNNQKKKKKKDLKKLKVDVLDIFCWRSYLLMKQGLDHSEI